MRVPDSLIKIALSNPVLSAKLSKYTFDEWLFYSNQFPVIFQYTYCDNEENQRRGRVGRVSGFRQGVRNLKYIPQSRWPVTFNLDRRTYRYFDKGRQNWRSFRPGNFIQITAYWSEKLGRFVDTPEEVFEADLGLTTPSIRKKQSQTEIEKAAKALQRGTAKRQEQVQRQKKRWGDIIKKTR